MAASAHIPMPRTRVTASHLAWLVLIAAFAVFCVLCAVTAFGINYFLFQSTVPMRVSLEVGRGTAAYLLSSDPDENVAPPTGHFLVNNERIRVDGQSQATISVRDSYAGDRLIAAITMSGANGSSVYLGRAQRPRFNWSSVAYRIDLGSVSGELDIYIPEGLPRPIFVSIGARDGALVFLDASGTYHVAVTDSRVQVFNRDGQAFVTPHRGTPPQFVAPGQQGTLALGLEPAQITMEPGPVNLLPPSRLQRLDLDHIVAANTLLTDLVQPWQCGDSQADPPGTFEVGVPDGRPGIHLFRANATSHGETGCSYSPDPGPNGLDVRGFESLVLRTSFYIEDQSLAFCGNAGSECALTLQIDYKYLDEEGMQRAYNQALAQAQAQAPEGAETEVAVPPPNPNDFLQPNIWYHGFYAKADPNVSWPTRCSSCLLDHERVSPGTWYTYESPNLIRLLGDQGQRPVSILRVRFYASGHEYDVYVGDVALYAE